MRHIRMRTLSLVLVAAFLLSLCGCKRSVEDIRDIKPDAYATESEVVDYYKEAMSYDTVAKRTAEVHRVTYEDSPVSKTTENSLIGIAKVIDAELGAEDWDQTFHVSKYQHQFIKYITDDKVLTLSGSGGVTTALGYFFVDLKYKATPQLEAWFTPDSKYVGINGAYTDNMQGVIAIDEYFMSQANQDVLEYCQEHGVSPGTLSIPAGNQETPRKSYYDIALYNEVSGSSRAQSAFMPPIKMAIVPAAKSGNISGYGMYPQGRFGMKDFGYDRATATGEMALRYVFKESLETPGVIDFINVYPLEYTADSLLNGWGTLVAREEKLKADGGDSADGGEAAGAGEKITTNNAVSTSILIPQFVETEITNALERSDRIIANGDLAAILGGKVYEDIGVGFLRGFFDNSCYSKRHMSKLVDVVSRHGNKYLADVETTIQCSPINTSQVGTYVQKAYMVFEQVGMEFTIDDYVVYDFKLLGEPQLDIDSGMMKQLAALNLRGEVPDGSKKEISKLIGNLHEASTARKLNSMYACFNTDTDILSSKHNEYLNSLLRDKLTHMGTSTPSVYSGQVAEWIGGNDKQAELIVEELIQYEGKDTAMHMQTYYLVSSYNDVWVIDDMSTISTDDISASEAASIAKRLVPLKGSSSGDGEDTNPAEIVRDFGEITLSDVVVTSEIDGATTDGSFEGNAGAGTSISGGGTSGGASSDTSTGDANASTNSGGQYVWSDKLGDYVWQAG